MEFSFFIFLSLNLFTFNALPHLNFSITPNFTISMPSSIKNNDLDLVSLTPEGYVFSWVEKIDSNTSFLRTKTLSYFGIPNKNELKIRLPRNSNTSKLMIKSSPNNVGCLYFFMVSENVLQNSNNTFSLIYNQNISNSTNEIDAQNATLLVNVSLGKPNLSFPNILDVVKIRKDNQYLVIFREKNPNSNGSIIRGVYCFNLETENQNLGLENNKTLSETYKDIVFIQTKALKHMEGFFLIYLVQNYNEDYQLFCQFFKKNQ